MAAAVDTAYLAAAFSFPNSELQSLVDAPTVDLVQAFLAQLTSYAKEHERLQADKLKTEIKFETTVRNADTRVRQLRETVDQNIKDIDSLRQKLNHTETSRNALAAELQELKSSSTTSSSEAQSLQSRIASLESSNRDTVSLLDKKSAAHDRLTDDLSAQQQKIIALRREVSELEDKLQKAENASMSAKFRDQTLQQEVELLKKNNEWQEEELKRRSSEQSKFRKEKAAQVAQLQRTNEDASQTIESLRRTETTLRNNGETLNQKLDDSFRKIQLLEEEAANSQESSRAELENAHRLAKLQEQKANASQSRLREVQQCYDQLKEDAAVEIGQLQAEIESEREDKEALETRVSEYETHVESLEHELSEVRRQASRPATPRGVNGNNLVNTPGRASPGLFSSPAASRLKGNMSMTQIYSEHTLMKSELEKERQRNERLRSTMDDMIQDLEKQQPGIEELRMDHGRLQDELEAMSAELESSLQERDASRKEKKNLEGETAKWTREAELRGQQLRDLSMQITVLLAEQQYKEQGMESLSTADRSLLEQAINGEMDVSEMEGVSDTGRLISQRLTIFRNVQELQEQNMRLGHLTRKLGEEMEGEEARVKRQQHEQDQKELEELRERTSKLQDELKSISLRAESYVRERDMFRRMLVHRGQLPPDADLPAMFGQSLSASAVPQSTSTFDASGGVSQEPSQTSKDLADLNRLLKEMQTQYDNYRQEASNDYSSIKDQLNRISKEKSDIQSELVKTSSQLTLAQERYELLQSNMGMLKTENGELQKRSSSLAETAAKQDLRTQQVAEELIEARSFTDGLRNENANLKAERELWKRIESRLGEDNRQLVEDRSRLNKMMTDLQTLQNERELTDSEARRRLQSRADSLEAELQVMKRKLDDELEDNKKAVMRREYEQEQNRTRNDDLLKSNANLREELASTKTQRDQLQARVEEIKVDLRAAEEKAQALHPRLTSGPRTVANGGLEDQENQLTTEQELNVQIAEMKRDLELAKQELQQATEHVEQYKDISQAAEDELQTMTETHDQFKDDMDRIAAEKDARIQDLEKRVDEISAELASTNTELSELRAQQEQHAGTVSEQKAMFEAELARLRDESERFSETSKLHQQDLKAQAEIAQRAQQSYEDELVKHAEAAKLLQTVRTEHNQLKTEVAGYKAEAEAAKVNLNKNEETWAEARTRYEQELTDLRTRREDVNVQNRRLHQQLEAISVQITALKQARPTTGASSDEQASTFDATDNREEIITWLKNEKEIVEVQLELSVQEAKRYKQKLDYAESQLDETREKLNQERASHADQEQAAMSHDKLMESINQLNVFRESNASLRNEARQAQRQLAEKITAVEALSAQLEPMRARLREVENELENKEGDIKLLHKDRDRWQKRTQDILQKYDRIDPAELEALNVQIKTLESEKETLVAEKETLVAEKTALESSVDEKVKHTTDELNKDWEDRRQKLIESAKAKAREQSGIIREKNNLIEQLQKAKDQSDQELQSIKFELEKVQAERDQAVSQSQQAAPEVSAEDAEDAEDGQIQESKGPSAEDVAALEAKVQAAEGQVSEKEERINALGTQISTLQEQLMTANNEIERLKQLEPPIQGTEAAAELEILRTQLAALQQEMESARATASAPKSAENPAQPPAVKEEEIEQLVAARQTELEEHYKTLEKAAEDKATTRTEKMKATLNMKLKDIRAEQEKTLEALKAEHQAEIEKIKSEKQDQSVADLVVNSEEEPSATGEMSQKQIQDLIASNPTALNIIKRNVQGKVKIELDKMKTEYDKKVEETQANFEQQKEAAANNARILESKKLNVKLSMADRKAGNALAKLGVVETAAKDTPQRPVVEVWEVAKNTSAQPNAPALVPSIGSVPLKGQPHAQGNSAPANPFGGQPRTATVNAPFGALVLNAAPNPFATGNAPLPQTSQTLPAKPQLSAGTGPNVLGSIVAGAKQESQAQSGIPKLGGAGRGTGIPRGGSIPRGAGLQRGGRGSTRGRGGQHRGGSRPDSPSALNPGAVQFAPTTGVPGAAGNKRPFDGLNGPGDNAGKRPRQ